LNEDAPLLDTLVNQLHAEVSRGESCDVDNVQDEEHVLSVQPSDASGAEGHSRDVTLVVAGDVEVGVNNNKVCPTPKHFFSSGRAWR
jgi:hypothetical protein